MPLLIQRALLALCLIILANCSTACREWIFLGSLTKIPCFNSGRLLLGPESDNSRLEIEIDRTRSGIRFFVNLLFLQAPPLQDDPSRTKIKIIFEEQEPWEIYPYLFSGGQRLLIPGDDADILIQALLDGFSFSIQIGRSFIHVIPDKFIESYAKLLAIPIDEDVP
jgi:hypothetical protein